MEKYDFLINCMAWRTLKCHQYLNYCQYCCPSYTSACAVTVIIRDVVAAYAPFLLRIDVNACRWGGREPQSIVGGRVRHVFAVRRSFTTVFGRWLTRFTQSSVRFSQKWTWLFEVVCSTACGVWCNHVRKFGKDSSTADPWDLGFRFFLQGQIPILGGIKHASATLP